MGTYNDSLQAGHPMITPISHPLLRKVGQFQIHRFLKEWDRYILCIQDAISTGDGVFPGPVSITSAVDTDLLQALIDLDEFGVDIKLIEELDDQALRTWLELQLGNSLGSTTVEQIEATVRASVRMNMFEPDAKLRAMRLFADYSCLLKSKNWEALIADNPKMAIRQITALLKPPALKRSVTNALQLSHFSLKKDWKGFYKFVVEQARHCEAFVPAYEPHGKETTYNGKLGYQKAGKAVKEDEKSSFNSTAHRSADKKGGNERQPKYGETSKIAIDSNKLPKCLNTDCTGHHFIKNCPITSPEKAKLLVEQYRNRSRAIKHLTDDQRQRSRMDCGRIEAVLADKVKVIVNGDYGADHASLSMRHLRLCAEAGIFVQVLPLQQPIRMQLAMDGNTDGTQSYVYAHQKARISTTLSTSSGPLRLRNVEYLVFDEKMDEVLLSRPVLQSLGFNLDLHLSTVRDTFHDADFSHIGFSPKIFVQENEKPPKTPGHLSRLLLGHSQKEDTLDGSTAAVFYGDGVGDEGDSDDDVSTGVQSQTELHEDLRSMLTQAIENGLPQQYHNDLSDILHKYADIFRSKLGNDAPAKVNPMKIRLKSGVTPVRAAVRRYSPPQLEFIRAKISELESMNLVYRNPHSSWASAPLIVPKAGKEKFRFTVDLRAVNARTEKEIWPMPNLEIVTTEVADATCFASLDLCQGYWQLPLATESQECQSFICPDGVYTPTRVLHGQCNAVSFIQSTLAEICDPTLQRNLLKWLDDVLAHARTPKELLHILRQFFDLCVRHNLKLHSKKCTLYQTEVTWCGRRISKDGVRMDPRQLSAILSLDPPQDGRELQQFVCALNWMRTVIPEYNKKMQPLADLLEKVYSACGKRTKRGVAKIKLNAQLWTQQHSTCFQNMKEELHHSATLAHYDDRKRRCLFTDASEKHWAAVLTQIPDEDKDLPFVEQRHEPLSFLSGSFKESSLRWCICDKEAYAIIAAISRLDYLLHSGSSFWLFTDHKNLTYIFDPAGTRPSIAKHVANRVERWAMKLAAFRYEIVHISGDDNVWADLLSRWGAPGGLASPTVAAILRAPVAPDLDPDFKWPRTKELLQIQRTHLEATDDSHNALSANAQGLLVNNEGSIWLPSECTDMQLRMCVIGHCGRGGHRGADTTYENIKRHCFWNGMKGDISVFCNSCLHCLSTTGGYRVPRPMGHALHAEKPNELIHFDFLYMNARKDGQKRYVLIIKDDLSSFIMLQPTAEATAEIAATCLLNWFSLFGVVLTWVSDQGSHFKNQVMESLNRQLHAHHHFTTPNCPQGNGTVETVCKEVIRATRALLSEFRLKEHEWPIVLPLIQSILNNTVRPALSNHAPITVFSGLPADNPLRTLLPPSFKTPATIRLDVAQKHMQVQKLVTTLNDIHRDVAQCKTRKRKLEVERHNQKTHICKVNFVVGDFVLVADILSKKGSKLRVKWKGPRQIIRVESDLIYEVKDIINSATELIHANRIKLYADSSLHLTETLKDTIAHNDVHYETVTKILGLRFNKDTKDFEVNCKWRGFAQEEPSWEPFGTIQEDIPEMLATFLQSYENQELVKAAEAAHQRD